MAAFADDDMIVHRDSERRRDIDDRLGHLDISLRRRRVAGGVVVHDTAASTIILKKRLNWGFYIAWGR